MLVASVIAGVTVVSELVTAGISLVAVEILYDKIERFEGLIPIANAVEFIKMVRSCWDK